MHMYHEPNCTCRAHCTTYELSCNRKEGWGDFFKVFLRCAILAMDMDGIRGVGGWDRIEKEGMRKGVSESGCLCVTCVICCPGPFHMPNYSSCIIVSIKYRISYTLTSVPA